jgi:hypothetical protein
MGHGDSSMTDPNPDICGKCGAEIDTTRPIDYTLKDGTRVCHSCFVKGTASPTRLGLSTEAKP